MPSDVRGPWRFHELDREAFDPGLFIEPDGRAYLATASTADGTITLLTLDAALAARHRCAENPLYQGRGGIEDHPARRLLLHVQRAAAAAGADRVARAQPVRPVGDARPDRRQDRRTSGCAGRPARWRLVRLRHGGQRRDRPDDQYQPGLLAGRLAGLGHADGARSGAARAAKPIAGAPFAEPATSDGFAGRRSGCNGNGTTTPIRRAGRYASVPAGCGCGRRRPSGSGPPATR